MAKRVCHWCKDTIGTKSEVVRDGWHYHKRCLSEKMSMRKGRGVKSLTLFR
jgi:hypothetical protein